MDNVYISEFCRRLNCRYWIGSGCKLGLCNKDNSLLHSGCPLPDDCPEKTAHIAANEEIWCDDCQGVFKTKGKIFNEN